MKSAQTIAILFRFGAGVFAAEEIARLYYPDECTELETITRSPACSKVTHWSPMAFALADHDRQHDAVLLQALGASCGTPAGILAATFIRTNAVTYARVGKIARNHGAVWFHPPSGRNFSVADSQL